jgi:hypothetical protein
MNLNCRPTHRIRGRDQLTRRLAALLLATHRFGRRARTHEELTWTARLLDKLQAALDEARA